jgi:hypothetical protein
MSIHQCPHEDAVVAAVLAGHWPDGCDDALRAHVTGCTVCASVAEVARLLRGEHDMLAHVQLPSAGQIWWRAAVRARSEGARAAARPITWVQAGAGAAAIGAVCALVAALWPAASNLAAKAGALAVGVDPGSLEIVMPALPLVERNVMVLVAVGVGVVLTPLIVLYFALSDE